MYYAIDTGKFSSFVYKGDVSSDCLSFLHGSVSIAATYASDGQGAWQPVAHKVTDSVYKSFSECNAAWVIVGRLSMLGVERYSV